MRILYLITGLGLGGAEKVVCDLADQMVKKGHEVKIAYLTGDKVITPKSPNIEIIYLGLNGINSFIFASLKYRQLLKNFQPNVIHAHMVHANIFTRLNRVISHNYKLISTAHSNNEGGQTRMLAYRLTHYLSDVTTNVSNKASQEFVKRHAVPANSIVTVYNGIDLKKFTYTPTVDKLKDKITYIAVGRFHDAKDYPNLLRAFSELKNKQLHREMELLIVGQTDDVIYPKLQELIIKNNLESAVKILGKKDNIPELLSHANYFILSSKYEGFGLVIAEAMACGCFVIATDCGGTAEIMGDTGILVPPQDSQALAQAMQQALSLTDEQIEVNNKRARKRIEELFSLEKSVEKWLEIYEAKQ